MDGLGVYSEQIDAYVQGRMEEAERVRFEEIIAKNPALKEEVDQLLSYHESFGRNDVWDFQATLASVSKDYHTTKKAKTRPLLKLVTPRFLGAAAVVGLLAISLAFWWGNRPTPLQYPQYAEVVVVYESQDRVRDQVSTIDSLYSYFETQVNKQASKPVRTTQLIKELERYNRASDYQAQYQLAHDLLLARLYLKAGYPKKTLALLDRHWPEDQRACGVNYYRAIALLEVDRKSEASSILSTVDCESIEVHDLVKALQNIARE